MQHNAGWIDGFQQGPDRSQRSVTQSPLPQLQAAHLCVFQLAVWCVAQSSNSGSVSIAVRARAILAAPPSEYSRPPRSSCPVSYELEIARWHVELRRYVRAYRPVYTFE